MFSCGIDVGVAENIRHQIYVSCLKLEFCAEGAPEFMGRYFFEFYGRLGIFFDHKLNLPYGYAFAPVGQKKRFVVLVGRGMLLSVAYIVREGFGHLIAEIYLGLLAALSCYHK